MRPMLIGHIILCIRIVINHKTWELYSQFERIGLTLLPATGLIHTFNSEEPSAFTFPIKLFKEFITEIFLAGYGQV